MNLQNKRIMILKIGAIGDVLMTTPFVRQLRKANPRAQIDYWIGQKSSAALDNNTSITHVRIFDESIIFKRKILAFRKLIKEVMKEKYDAIFILDKHWIFSLFAKLCKIKERIGFDRSGKEGLFLTKKTYYRNDKHEIFYYLDLLKVAGIKYNYKDIHMDLKIIARDQKYVNQLWNKNFFSGKKIICIAPGGGKNAGENIGIRNMPVDMYLRLINILIADPKVYIILVGSKDDKDKEKYLLKKCKSDRLLSFVGKCTISETAALMRKSNCVICNDSGTMHIAGAVNTHVISIFGPTNPKRKAPLSKESVAIWSDRRLYEPEYELRGKIPHNKEFFKNINVEDIIKLMQNRHYI